MGTGTHAVKLCPQAPQSITAPTSWGPLLAPYCPNCPSSTATTSPQPPTLGLQTRGFIDWFWIILYRIAYLSLRLCLHHKKIISCDYLLFLIGSLAHSLISTLLCCFMTKAPAHLNSIPPPSHSLFSSFFSLGGWIQKASSPVSSYCVLLYRHSSASCLFTQYRQLGPHLESKREDMRWA